MYYKKSNLSEMYGVKKIKNNMHKSNKISATNSNWNEMNAVNAIIQLLCTQWDC